jgi:glycerol uptake facilitator-like aquaporin
MDQGAKSYWAEFLGTFTLCFAGQGAICTAQQMGAGAGALLGIAVAHGLALAVMISAFGPALVAGFFENHWIFWVAPMLGGAAAALIYANVVLRRK